MARIKKETEKLWLQIPKKLVKRPIVYEIGHKFKVVTDIRQASVHTDIALISLELIGERKELTKAIKWLEKIGVKVQPVEINVIEG